MPKLDLLFDEYELLLLISPAVAKFTVVKRRVLESEGYIRVRVELTKSALLEFSEFWDGGTEDEVALRDYAYH